MKYLWRRWKRLVKRISAFQTNLVLTIIFWVIIVPLFYVIKIFFGSYLSKIRSDFRNGKYWQKKQYFKQDLVWAKKQG